MIDEKHQWAKFICYRGGWAELLDDVCSAHLVGWVEPDFQPPPCGACEPLGPLRVYCTGSGPTKNQVVFFGCFFGGNRGETGTKKTEVLKVVDSRPARSAGRVKKSCFKTLEKFWVCYEGSILSFKVTKIHPVLLADEFSISKNTHNANFTKIWLKQAF